MSEKEKPEFFGNEIWNRATDNKNKSILHISNDSFLKVREKLDAAEINYYAYSRNNLTVVAISDSDIDFFKRHIGVDDSEVTFHKSGKAYTPNSRIIGNTSYRDIAQKGYFNTNADIALKIAEKLDYAGYAYSGSIWSAKKATITVEQDNLDIVQNLNEQILEARKEAMSAAISSQTQTLADVSEIDNEVVETVEETVSETQNQEVAENPIHFGLLGNGITVYDTSKYDKSIGDYKTIAHISDEGIINYYTNDISDADRAMIEKQASIAKDEFTSKWNSLSVEAKYERVFDGFLSLIGEEYQSARNDFLNSDMSMEEKVAKYEHSLIFKDEPFPVSNMSKEPQETAIEVDSDVQGGEQLNLFGEEEQLVNTAVKDERRYSIIAYSRFSGSDEKPECSTLTEARKEARRYLNGEAYGYEDYNNEPVHDDTVIIWDTHTDMVVDILGDEFNMRGIFGTDTEKRLIQNAEFTSKFPYATSVIEDELAEKARVEEINETSAAEEKEDVKESLTSVEPSAKTFAEQVDEALAGEMEQYNALKVCDTPQLLLDVGCRQLPMLYTQRHLRQALKEKSSVNPHSHGLTEEQIKELPELIQNPAMIYDSLTKNDSIVLALSKVDSDSLPLIVSVKPNGKGTYELEKVDSNFITSLYGKDNFSSHIEKVANSGNLLYWDKEKSQELFRVSRLQLPGCLNSFDSDVIIHQSRNIVKSASENSQEIAPKIEQVAEPTSTESKDSLLPFKVGDRIKYDSGRGEEQLWAVNSIDIDRNLIELNRETGNIVIPVEQVHTSLSEVAEYVRSHSQAQEQSAEPTVDKSKDDSAISDFEYRVNDDGNAVITKYTGSNTDVTIPSEIEGHKVTEIGEGAFFGYDRLTSIVIPDSVTSIDNVAFYNCSNLENITIPNSVASIGDRAFYHCAGLKGIALPDSLMEINSGVFSYCDWLESIVIPDSTTNIGEYAFNGCTRLETIIIPNNVKWIDEGAFKNCTSLKNVELPADTKVAKDSFPQNTVITRREPQEQLAKPTVDESKTVEQESSVSTDNTTPVSEATDSSGNNSEVKEPEKTAYNLSVGDRFMYRGEVREISSLTTGLYPDDVVVVKVTPNFLYTVTENIDKFMLVQDGEYLGNSKDEVLTAEMPSHQEQSATNQAHGSAQNTANSSPEKTADSTPQNVSVVTNFRITDDSQLTGKKTKFRANADAIRTLKTVQSENRPATDDEKRTMSLYSGWGGIQEAFDDRNTNWSNEYAELKELLTPDEYRNARSTVLDAFYTNNTVIDSIYKVLENAGFKGGNVLEPSMGIGNFFGRLPDSMSASNLYGVEKDGITGGIAKLLYPNADITVSGFEKTDFQNGSFDVAIGNVPFGDTTLKYGSDSLKIHDYFFAQTLDKVRDGGVVAFITSSGTLDKASTAFRESIAQKADLLGAVRLPNNAFSAAGTSVTSDIIFLRKRSEPPTERPQWVDLGESATGLKYNSYFVNHPEMVMGRIEQGGMYGRDDSVICVPDKEKSLQELLSNAVKNINFEYTPTQPEKAVAPIKHINERQSKNMPKPPEELPPQSFFVGSDDKVYYYGHLSEDKEVRKEIEQRMEIAAQIDAEFGNTNATEHFKQSDLYVSNLPRVYSLESVWGENLATTDNEERIKAFVAVRDIAKQLIAVQQSSDVSDETIKSYQDKLNTAYDAFYSKYGSFHGDISKRINANVNANRRLIKDFDGSFPLVSSLEEKVGKDGKLEKKAAIFSERVSKPNEVIEHVDTPLEALQVSVATRGKVDLQYMSELCGLDRDSVISQLTNDGEIYPVPELSSEDSIVYQTANEYLSGDIYEKLAQAEYAAVDNPKLYQQNIEALEKVKPEPLSVGDINVNLGATWIGKEYYQQFMYETFQTSKYLRQRYDNDTYPSIKVNYEPYSSTWTIDRSQDDRSVIATETFGTKDKNAYQILEDLLNLKDTKIYKVDKDEKGNIIYERDKDGNYKYDKNGRKKPHRVIDIEATKVVQYKAELIQKEFQNWIFKDPERRDELVAKYNRIFNCIRPREYDGSRLEFSGMNTAIELRDHQKDAVARAIYGGNTLFAHSVGAGKTYEMIASVMESKKLGLSNKALIAVPNDLTEQVGEDFQKLYPAANILVASKNDFKKENRKVLMAKIATGNYDAVIIGHSQLAKVPLTPEKEIECLEREKEDIVRAIKAYYENNHSGKKGFSIKRLEKEKKKIEEQIAALKLKGRDENNIYFDELGIDKLVVDEAHEFKNLLCITKMENVAGLSVNPSKKAQDLFLKCQYMDEKTGGKGIIFATGTPVSNSITELHTMMKYLNYDYLLKHNDMQGFDNWISTFGIKKSEYELTPVGNDFHMRTRIEQYTNMPELMGMYKEFADVKTADTLNLKVPECETHIVELEPTDFQKSLVQELAARAEDVHSNSINGVKIDDMPKIDNMLSITGDGRKVGLDPRLIDPEFEDNPNSKINLCVNNVYDIYADTVADKSAQIIFCDLGTPKGKTNKGKKGKKSDKADTEKALKAFGKMVGKESESEETSEENVSIAEAESLEETGKFCIYDDIKQKLIDKGVSPKEIAFIHDADTEAKKTALFDKVRNGEVRILIGSTAKMGTGTNIQDRLIAQHDLDIPWRPADLEQRRGRMVRQGNKNKKVHLYRYVTKGTFDAYSYQLLEKKQTFISQIMTSKTPVRSCMDIDQQALDYAEIKALCTGDPRIKEKLELENRVKTLNSLQRDYRNTKYECEDKIRTYPKEREALLTDIKNIKKDIALCEKLPVDKETGEPLLSCKFAKTTYTEHKEAAKGLGSAMAFAQKLDHNESRVVGSLWNFKVELKQVGFSKPDLKAYLEGNGRYEFDFHYGATTNLKHLRNIPDILQTRLAEKQMSLEKLDVDYKAAQETVAKPFEYETEYKEKSARLNTVTKELNAVAAAALKDKNGQEVRTDYFGILQKAGVKSKSGRDGLMSIKSMNRSAKIIHNKATKKSNDIEQNKTH